jgi:phenylalanyl-tRNA synthetase beta chain
MKFSEQWLREWVQPAVSTEELAAQITLAGLEVDGIEPVAGAFTGVVVGEVVSREPHPDADKLSLCQVSDGQETFQVVCGAPNVRAGLKIPFAKIGAQLPGDFHIKKAKLRGVESFGMLCSQVELGLGDDNSGLLELPAEAPVGADIRDYLSLDDHIIEVDLTPNRADCLSMIGLAREVGVLNKAEVKALNVALVAASISDSVNIEVQAPSACPRYLGRVIKGVNVRARSPQWLVEKLKRGGIRAIDPVVDITNYLLLELGQPMHAFDLHKIQSGICVRMAKDGEKLKLLDGQEVSLKANTLVIADASQPLAMGGIMGGEPSSVTEQTQDILLEAAFFAPLAIANRARQYGLHTDSSHRFERGVDYELQRTAMERATALILSICGGSAGPISEVASAEHLPKKATISLRSSRIERLLGVAIAENEVTDILTRLGLQVSKTAAGWEAIAPSYRFDLRIEPDLIEEIARIYGYARLPARSPSAALPLAKVPEKRFDLKEIRRHFVARGYQEAITYSFIAPELQKHFDPEHEAIALLNPISVDMSVMRTNLFAGLVQALGYNLKRQQNRVRLFETGLRFLPQADGTLQQIPSLALAITGAREPLSWAVAEQEVDFFDLKGDIESLLARTGESYRFVLGQHPALHPGQTAIIEKQDAQGLWQAVGLLGALHPNLHKPLGIKQALFLAQLDVEAIQEKRVPKFNELSKFPEMRRDLALVVDKNVAVADLLAAIRASAGEHLIKLGLFDVYTGKGIDLDKKSLALGLTFQHPSRTLTDEEITNSVASVLAHVEKSSGAMLRS